MTLRYAYLAPVHKREAMEILGSRMDTFWRPEDSIEEAKNRGSENILENKGLFENGAVPKWLRERSAKPLFDGSNPSRASRNFVESPDFIGGKQYPALSGGLQNQKKYLLLFYTSLSGGVQG